MKLTAEPGLVFSENGFLLVIDIDENQAHAVHVAFQSDLPLPYGLRVFGQISDGVVYTNNGEPVPIEKLVHIEVCTHILKVPILPQNEWSDKIVIMPDFERCVVNGQQVCVYSALIELDSPREVHTLICVTAVGSRPKFSNAVCATTVPQLVYCVELKTFSYMVSLPINGAKPRNSTVWKHAINVHPKRKYNINRFIIPTFACLVASITAAYITANS